jgi:hypothetical protein
MTYRVIVDTVIAYGPQKVAVGQLIELPDEVAVQLLDSHVVEPVTASEPKPKSAPEPKPTPEPEPVKKATKK